MVKKLIKIIIGLIFFAIVFVSCEKKIYEHNFGSEGSTEAQQENEENQESENSND